MRSRTAIIALCLVAIFLAGALATIALAQTPLQKQNEQLFEKMAAVLGLTDTEMSKIRSIFAHSGYIGQGNPAITHHPVTPAQCLARLERRSIHYENARFEKICGAKFMAPLYDPATQKPEDAKACIDQFEFPDIPCTYPVVWVRAREAAELCEAQGKRMCDAHEWEGACAGSLKPPDYNFDLAKGVGPSAAVNRMRAAHNRKYAPSKRWSYGPAYRRGVCAAASRKSPKCNGGNWAQCGSNTYPTGDFPACHSPLGVYDLNGNAAEHMNLPLRPDQMSSRGSKTLGYTEMKGSWFIFDKYRAHPDWCRWRAPYWHGSRVMDRTSHANYHLGFRCCKTLDAH
jgi:formylglycine-generating enzyme required for sulfatase activity